MRSSSIGEDPGLFYAQAESVVRFLMSRPGGMAVFVAFAASVARDGIDQALAQHYGLADIGDLQAAWLASLD